MFLPPLPGVAFLHGRVAQANANAPLAHLPNNVANPIPALNVGVPLGAGPVRGGWNNTFHGMGGALPNAVPGPNNAPIQPYSLHHLMLAARGRMPMPGGVHAQVVNGRTFLVAAPPVGGDVTHSVTASVQVVHLRAGANAAQLIAAAQGAVGGRYGPNRAPTTQYMHDKLDVWNHLTQLPNNGGITLRRYTVRLQFTQAQGEVFTEEIAQAHLDNYCNVLEAQSQMRYLVLCNARIDFHHPSTYVVANTANPIALADLRVLDDKSGVCWLDAIVECINNHRQNGVVANHAIIAHEMRTRILPQTRGNAEAAAFDPRKDGVTARELILWAQEFESQYTISIYISSLFGFVYAQHVCAPDNVRHAVRLFLLQVSATHVVVRPPSAATRRGAITGDMMGIGQSLPPYIAEETQVVFARSIGHLKAIAPTLHIEPSTRVISVVWFNDDDPDSEFDDLGDLMVLAAREVAATGRVFVPEFVTLNNDMNIMQGVDCIRGFGMYRDCVWLMDSKYLEKIHILNSLSSHPDFGLVTEFCPERICLSHQSLPALQHSIFWDLFGSLPPSQFSPRNQHLFYSHKGHNLVKCFKPVLDAEDVCELDIPGAYSHALANSGGIPVYSVTDDPLVLDNARAWCFRRGYVTIGPDGRNCYDKMPAAMYVLSNCPHISWFPAPITNLVLPRVSLVYYLEIGALQLSDIAAICLPTSVVPAKVFEPTVAQIFHLLGAKEAKRLVNTVVGIMGRTEQRGIRVAFAASELAQSLAQSEFGHNADRHSHISPVADVDDLFMVMLRETKVCTSTLLMVYLDVVARNQVRLLQLAKRAFDAGVQIYATATDALVVARSEDTYAFAREFEVDDSVNPLTLDPQCIRLKMEVPSAPYRFIRADGPLDYDGFMGYASDVLQVARGEPAPTRVSLEELMKDATNENSKGCVVTGPAGSGKTWTTAFLLRRLAELHGPKAALMTTQTGLLCNKLTSDGLWTKTFEYMCTLHSKNRFVFWSKFGRLKAIAVDESARMNNRFLELLMQMRAKSADLKIYIVGDPHQVRGFDENKSGDLESSPEYHNCSAVRELVGNRLCFVHAREEFCRFADQATFNAVAAFRREGTLVPGAFTILDNPIVNWEEEKVNIALTLTRAMRTRINAAQLRRLVSELRADGHDDLILEGERWCNGQRVVTCKQFCTELGQEPDDEPRDVFNGDMGELSIVDTEEGPIIFFLQDHNPNAYELRITLEELDSYFRGAYASTVACFQGREIDGEFHVVESEKMDKSELYTAISRCVRKEDVRIVPQTANRKKHLESKTWPVHREWAHPDDREPAVAARIRPVQLAIQIYRPAVQGGLSFVLAQVVPYESYPDLEGLYRRLFTANAQTTDAIGLTAADIKEIRDAGEGAFVCAEDRSPCFVATKGAACEVVRTLTATLPNPLGDGLTGSTVFDAELGRSLRVFDASGGIGGDFPLVGNDEPAVLGGGDEGDEDAAAPVRQVGCASSIRGTLLKDRIRFKFRLFESKGGAALEPCVFVVQVLRSGSIGKARKAWERMREGARECVEADRANLVVRMGGDRKWQRAVDMRARDLFSKVWGASEFTAEDSIFDREESESEEEDYA